MTDRFNVTLPNKWFHITATPEGEAPKTIREAWVGLAYPVLESLGRGALAGTEIISGKTTDIDNPVQVSQRDAILTLRQSGRDEAASWWQENNPQDSILIFQKSEGELLDNEIFLEVFGLEYLKRLVEAKTLETIQNQTVWTPF